MKGHTKTLRQSRLFAEGRDLGFIEDCLFDERTWYVSYFVATIDTTRPRKQLLLSTNAVRAIDWDTPAIDVLVSQEQLEKQPTLQMTRPLSRNLDAPIKNYQWPFFFTGAGTFGVDGFPEPATLSPEDDIGFGHNLKAIGDSSLFIEDRHLRSTRNIEGYRIHASNGVFGQVEDFIFDVANWKIKALLVDTQAWWNAKSIEVRPQDIKQISWENSEVLVNAKKEHLAGAPYTESNTWL